MTKEKEVQIIEPGGGKHVMIIRRCKLYYFSKKSNKWNL
jgi:hypothetical protein